jgi:hypothetical protein
MNAKIAILTIVATPAACKTAPVCPAGTKQLVEGPPNGSELAAGATSVDVFTLARVL